MVDGAGRRIAGPPDRFASDAGEADGHVRSTIADPQHSTGDLLAVLRDARLLVPVVAVLDSAGESPAGLTVDKDSHMASVSIVAADGRRGLLAFTGVDAIRAWDDAARPVPGLAPDVAQAALDDGADVLILDLAGPVRAILGQGAVRALAGGEEWIPHRDPAILDAIAAAAAALGVRARVAPGEDSEGLTVIVEASPHAPEAARALAGLLSGSAAIREARLGSLAVAVES